ncbi:hypothetical protein [Paenibacillus thermotolerans]|uniref:hypothetical protein n=1 Tax=Paenibacillus thermotolerans TaxID=3027807 RepID=UPI00236793F1|nr:MULTISPECIES: hypothetical protein [unclassified Paenibacillus]
MNIYEALKQLPPKKRIYCKWKFNLWFDQERQMTEEELMKQLGVKSLNAYVRWEREDDYKHFVSVYLASKTADDLLDVYEVVRDKAIKGDPKAIDTLLKLQNQITAHKKAAEQYFADVEEDEDDGLEV